MKKWVKVDKENDILIFRSGKMLPYSEVIFIATIYLMECFINENGKIDEMISLFQELEKKYLFEWYGLHHLYLLGYTNFSRWQNKVRLNESGYRQWCRLLGAPVTGQGITILSLLKKINENEA